MPYCSNCGAEYQTGESFCKGCGNKLGEATMKEATEKKESAPIISKGESQPNALKPILKGLFLIIVLLIIAGVVISYNNQRSLESMRAQTMHLSKLYVDDSPRHGDVYIDGQRGPTEYYARITLGNENEVSASIAISGCSPFKCIVQNADKTCPYPYDGKQCYIVPPHQTKTAVVLFQYDSDIKPGTYTGGIWIDPIVTHGVVPMSPWKAVPITLTVH